LNPANSLVELTPNAIKLETDLEEAPPEDIKEVESYEEVGKFKPIFDTIIATFKSKSKENIGDKDLSDSDEFSSDSDDEETNLLNNQIKDVSEPTKCRVRI
jgi:hypothetical protein